MSIWSSLIGKILGSSSSIKSGMEMIDEAVYTKQEQAENKNIGITLKANLLNSYHAYKVTQRSLALIIAPPYIFACMITFFCSFFIDVTDQIELLEGRLGQAFVLIMGFYFGGGTIESLSKLFKRA